VTKKGASVLVPSCELGVHEVGVWQGMWHHRGFQLDRGGHGFTFSPRRVADAGGDGVHWLEVKDAQIFR